MIRRIAICTLLILAFDASAFAQAQPGGIARQIAMGGAQYTTTAGTNTVFNPFIYQDPAWALINPAYQGWYRDYLWLNVAGGGVTGANASENTYGSQFGGFGIGFGKEWTVGAILSYDPSYANTLARAGGFLNQFINTARPTRLVGVTGTVIGSQPAGVLPAVEVFELISAYKVSDMSIGLALSYGWTNKDIKVDPAPAAPTISSGEIGGRMFGVRAGAIVDLGSGNSVEGAFAFRSDKAYDRFSITGTGAPTGSSDYSATANEFQLSLRGRLRLSNKVNFIPYGVFRTVSATPKEEAILSNQTSTTYDLKRNVLTYAFGGGLDYTSKTVYLAAGVSIAKERTRDEETNPTTVILSRTTRDGRSSFPVFNVGAELYLAEWITGRVGYYRALGNRNLVTEVSTAAGTITTDGDLSGGSSVVGISGYGPIPDNSLITLGLGIRVAGFALDATVSDEALRRGLGLIGASDNINTFGYLTLSFSFD
jgi:hypothetical protein